METVRCTMAQALVEFLKQQHVDRDGRETPFFAGAWGIFGHGSVAGVGQALRDTKDFRYYLCRNEQAMVHTAIAYAKMKNRLSTYVCTTSIGPGATNMVTGAATATINRIPVLLLPGDIFARRNVAPVLQQLESEHSQDISVNDAFKCVSRYWDRINRPEQLPYALPEVMRVLTSPAETGAVTLCLPQDVQAEAHDFPADMFRRRVWRIPRPLADRGVIRQAVQWIREAKTPIIIAGGGVLYSEATDALDSFATQTGIAVAETMAGKGSLPYTHEQNLEAMGVTGTPGANLLARDADLVISIGTRLSDFTTASKTAFQNPNVRFLNINIAEFDAYKQAALPVTADARVTLEELSEALQGHRVSDAYAERVRAYRAEWQGEVDRLFGIRHGPPISQSEVIGLVNGFSDPKDVVICAAGSLPGDLHKLWRTSDTKGYHLEYGYSCMGYEIAGGIGIKMADPSREVYVMVGDGSYQMMSNEIATSVQEGYKLSIILLDNHGFSSIGGLSQSVGCEGFGTDFKYRREESGHLDGAYLPVDFVANAASMGAHAVRARTHDDLKQALVDMKSIDRTTVIVVETDKESRVPGYESWWDVPVAQVSDTESVKLARKEYDEQVKLERHFI
ncbi:3D-(3,5/4)-trihydroxycyclohexane-1,2-dione acylhydrolase (decyclizing) [Candidatus Poribacteria bacterium]|jgi:3D-(3,5/4)-trihydroxycyclohexane-1,2-dione acylhydrolase (decyclizing)|nr:3D-(3,5/4)-trihydroxycyclohexane-1,2-dione acylhydrolase (decyclizing) [Candidatus Poribacteria bacterium]MBT5534219.1 3D-(3,5/4)-trihydroxycyclohexane-1,2-dione acylhydrolase (decyclizing) [Candidatus Poribacteria bacterium]MBT7100664.1 3D-(3,5/4)-trihydroxycyclohexane-1,2-dione acylhydrolase (decyclizing) [Candidatus Poribacteria bacterium]MBT7808873.1 3D-(3,5/4)-trihydroxycyclohexane-1,2-dione acylhydrolase (decyclizing) [Candidatus Poribacteria bacterium]